jgi:hypothetical protein
MFIMQMQVENAIYFHSSVYSKSSSIVAEFVHIDNHKSKVGECKVKGIFLSGKNYMWNDLEKQSLMHFDET